MGRIPPQPAQPSLPSLPCARPASRPSKDQQHQHVAYTDPTDTLRPRDDEAESKLECAPITSIRMEPPINRNRSGRISFTPRSNPRCRPLPSPRYYPLPGAKSTAPGASLKTDAHIGAFILAGGAPETADIDAELGPNRLTNTSRHCCPSSSQSEQNRFTMSLRCRRWKFHRKLRNKAPYMANSGEPPLRASYAAVRSAAPWLEPPPAVQSRLCDWD
jgi:hypothetical protein